MKTRTQLLFITLLNLFLIRAYATPANENCPLVIDQLIELNKYWQYHSVEDPILNEHICFDQHIDLIQLHLRLVESHLRKNSDVTLSLEQRENRTKGLDILRQYWQQGQFPINNHHPGQLVPYFIDDFNTACAVGHIVRETGYADFATKIHKENNYAYIEDLDYQELYDWAEQFGFDEMELRWIQPAYGCWADRTSIIVTNTSSSGFGSFAWAVDQANADPNPNTIVFDLPTNSVIYPTQQLFLTGECDAIDGFLLDWSGNVIIDGSNFSINNWGIVINCDDCEANNLIIRNYNATAIGAWQNDNIFFFNNILYGNNIGIVAAGGASNVRMENNRIGLNENWNNNSNNDNYGIWIEDAFNIEIFGNHIAGLNNAGIVLDSDDLGNSIYISYNTIGLDQNGTFAIPNFEGIFVGAAKSDVAIFNNLISGNDDAGINIWGAFSVAIYDNIIGGDINNDYAIPHDTVGVWIGNNASFVSLTSNTIWGNASTWGVYSKNSSNITIGGTELNKNTIKNCNVGIGINEPISTEIDVNELTCNQFPIWFVDQVFITSPPSISSATSDQVTGSSEPYSEIDVYMHDDGNCSGYACQGRDYLGSTTANGSGDWTLNSAIPIGVEVTALATNNSNTSSYADCLSVSVGDPCTVVTAATMCGSIVPQGANECFNPTSVFTEGDMATAFCNLDDIDDYYRIIFDWYDPDGNLFFQYVGDFTTANSGNWWYQSYVTSVTIPGFWTVDIYAENIAGDICLNETLIFEVLPADNSVPSSCEADQEIIDFYSTDAEKITADLMFSDPAYANQVELDPVIYERILDGLIAVYNATPIAERDTVVECLGIHNANGLLRYTSVSVAGSETTDWVVDLVNNIFPTSNATINNYFTTYNLSVINFSEFGGDVFFTIDSDHIINTQALANLFNNIPTVIEAYPNTTTIFCNNDVIVATSYETDYIDLFYSYAFPCVDDANWTFRIYNDCSVEFINRGGNVWEIPCNNNYQCSIAPLCLPWLQQHIDSVANLYCNFNCIGGSGVSVSQVQLFGSDYIHVSTACGDVNWAFYNCSGFQIDNCLFYSPSGGENCSQDYIDAVNNGTPIWNCNQLLPDCSAPGDSLPNLTISAAAGCTNYTFSDNVLSYTTIVENNGSESSTSTIAALYLSIQTNDSGIDYNDPVYIGGVSIPALAPGETHETTITADLCETGIISNTYGVGIVFDRYNSVSESNETFSENSAYCYIPIVFDYNGCIPQADTLVVTPVADPEDVVTEFFESGDCINMFNFSFIGNVEGIGQFQSGNATIGLSDGIVISNGIASQLNGANISEDLGTDLQGGSDLCLSQMATNNVSDATGFEFDFVPFNDQISLDFVFASEEYCEWVGSSFNDVFGIFLSGPNINGPFPGNAENLALVPNTTNYIGINTVNHTTNQNLFTGNNASCNSSISYYFPMDGWTDSIAAPLDLIVGATYHLKIVIGDVGDGIFDSAVFFNLDGNTGCGNICEPPPTGMFSQDLCQGDVFEYNNVVYTNSGTYETTLEGQSFLGCDSLVNFTLDFIAIPPAEVSASYCENEGSYFYPGDGMNYTEGVYPILFPSGSYQGCDSTVILTVTENFNSEANLSIAICEGDAYDVCSIPFSVSGFYEINCQSFNGCDSTILLDLQVLNIEAEIEPPALLGCGSSSSISLFSIGQPAENYSWTTPNGDICSDPTTEVITVCSPGTYCLEVSISEETPSQGIVECTNQTCVEVMGETESPNFDASIVDAFCGEENGSIDITINNPAIGPFDYDWEPNVSSSNLAENLEPGIYQVTVTANGNNCSATGSFIVNTPADITIEVTQTATDCSGSTSGSATTNVVGGAPPYTYAWCDGQTGPDATDLPIGTCGVTVTDSNDCSSIETVTIDAAAPLEAIVQSLQNVYCNNNEGALDVTIIGGFPPYSFEWSTGDTTEDIDNLSEGNYTLEVTDDLGCTVEEQYSIIDVGEPPVADFASTVSGLMVDFANQTTGPTDAYLWDFGDGNTSTQTNPSHVYASADTYQVCLEATNDCGTETFCSDVDLQTICESQAGVLTTPGPIESCDDVTVELDYDDSNAIFDNNDNQVFVLHTGPSSSLGTILDVNPNEPTFEFVDVSMDLDVTYYVAALVGNSISNIPFVDVDDPCLSISIGIAVTFTDCNTPCAGADAVIPFIQSTTDASCFDSFDGTAQATASGGTGIYTYLWCNGETNAQVFDLPAGECQVVVTDSDGCSGTVVANIFSPTPLEIISTNQQDVTCTGDANGEATVVPIGGTGAYQYAWCNGQTTATATGLSAGSCEVFVVDANGCSTSTIVTINEPIPISLSTTQVDVTCDGVDNGSATVIADGGTGNFTYNWCNGSTSATVNGLAAGTCGVTVVDDNGCQETISITIESNGISLTTTQEDIDCGGSNNGTATVTASGGLGSYTYVWCNGSTNATTNNLPAGPCQVVVTDVDGCTAEASVIIATNSDIELVTTQEDASCSGNNDGTAMVIASGGSGTYIYQWCNGTTNSEVNGLPAGSCQVVVTDLNGCTAETSVIIATNSDIELTTSQQNVDCFGDFTGSAVVMALGGAGGFTYQWCNGATIPEVNGLPEGLCEVVVTDLNNCSVSTTVEIQSSPAIVLSTTQENVACNGGADGTATVSASGGVGGFTYEWCNGQQGESATGLVVGSCSVTVTDASGCTEVATVNITSPNLLNVDTNQTNVSCNGAEDGTATAIVSGGMGTYTYLWCNGQTTPTATGLPGGACSVFVSDANGCTAESQVIIFNPDQLSVANISVSNPTCEQFNGAIDLEVTGGTSPYTYNWFPTGGSVEDPTSLAPGNYSVTITDANGCTSLEAIDLVDNSSIPVVDLGADTSFCVNESVLLDAGGSGIEYVWSQDGVDLSLGTNESTVMAEEPGVWAVVVTNADGCTAADAIVIGVNPIPSVDIATANEICADDSLTLNVLCAGCTYLWTTGATDGVQTFDETGTYGVTVTNAFECSENASFALSVNDLPDVQLGGDTSICNGDMVLLNAGNDGVEYFWSLNGVNQPASNGDAQVTVAEEGNWSVSVANQFNCIAEDAIFVDIAEDVDATLVSDKLQICPGDSVQLIAGGGSVYEWIGGGDYLSTLEENNPVAMPEDTVEFSVLVSNACSEEIATVTVDVFPMLATAGPDTCVGLGSELVLYASGGVEYVWEESEFPLSNYEVPDPVTAPEDTTFYVIDMIDENACMVKDTVHVIVFKNIREFIETVNVLTPNGDNLNDILKFKGLDKFPTNKLEVYNRWGGIVYESVNYKNDWDGTYKNKILPAGAYYYVLIIDDTVIKSALTIVREK